MAKTDAKLDKLAKLINGVANNQGSVAEEFFIAVYVRSLF
jgi:hypothetical protein